MTDADADRASRGKTQALLQALRYQPDEAACLACLNQLGGYVDAQLRGEDYQARFPSVALHLDTCLLCAEAYGRLYDVALADLENRLPQPSAVTSPDLGFLQPGVSLAQRLRAAVHSVGNRFTLTLSPELVALLRPPPSLSTVRGPAAEGEARDPLLLLEASPDLPLDLAAYQNPTAPETCTIEVIVALPSEAPPDLEGIAVSLRLGDVAETQRTDVWGLAVFEAVPVALLETLSITVDWREGR